MLKKICAPFYMFCLAVTSRCMVYHFELGGCMCLLSRNPGRFISEGTVAVWTIFDHLTISVRFPKTRRCFGLYLCLLSSPS